MKDKDGRQRVVWDMTFTVRSVSGTRVYTRNLYEALVRQGEFEMGELYGNRDKGAERHGNLSSNLRNMWWLLFDGERELRRAQPDLFHAAAYFGPWRIPCPGIVNVFDTTYVLYPQYFDWKWNLYARTAIPHTIKTAAAIVTLSEHAWGEIVSAYGLPRERVHIVPPGVGAGFRPPRSAEAVAAVRAKYKLPESYLIYVGGRNRRKNVPAMLEAFVMARQEYPDLHFVIAGVRRATTWLDGDIQRLGGAALIHELGFVPQEDLPLLYAGARASVFASKLEGFGIPPVEAMACGTPVVCAPNPPMPEVLGDAAWWTENDSPEALKAGIVRVLGDEALAQTLRARGIERAKMYAWDESARKMMGIYREVLARR